jgi:hypothetical protein
MHISCRFTNIQNFKETCTNKDYADCLMVHFSVISCWYTLADLLLCIFPFRSLGILNILCIYSIIHADPDPGEPNQSRSVRIRIQIHKKN